MWFFTSTAKGREGGSGGASGKSDFELGRGHSAKEVVSRLVGKQLSLKFRVSKGCFPPLKSDKVVVCECLQLEQLC